MGAPAPSDHRQAEMIAKELAFEAMKWLLRCGGDATRLSELGRGALTWAGAQPDERDAALLRGGPAPDGPEFVRNTEDRVWVSRPILRSRGWTDAAIRDFLPEPEGLKPNPRFVDSGHPMPVWLPETIAEAEAAEGWQRWLQKSLRRRGTTLRALAETDDEDFQSRLKAVQEAIDAYLQAKITRRNGREAVRPG
ncbi:hypothetical protein GCM10029992_09470 [Glycomyces albus]